MGRVVVRSEDTIYKRLKDSVYLVPGDELVYSKKTFSVSITHKASEERMVKTHSVKNTNATVNRPDWYTFDGFPLSAVFDQLSAYYQVDIYYYPSEIENKYFAGKIKKTDSLENILNDISLLNSLSIRKEHDAYFVRKAH